MCCFVLENTSIKLRKIIMKKLLLILVIFSSSVYPNYDANFTGKVTHVLTYPYSKLILLKVEGQPTSHPICSSFDYLAIDTDVEPESRQMVLSRLLVAYTSGETINIGYDSKDECAGNRIKIYRVG